MFAVQIFWIHLWQNNINSWLTIAVLATLNEEEALNENGDAEDELRLLNEENEMSVEELRRRYYGDAAPAEPTLPSDISDQPSSSATTSLVATQTLKTFFVESALSDSEDEEYVPAVPEYWKKEIRIGDEYQVSYFDYI